jgi:capsule polysaccharide export protein KpsC/LpsZ
MRDRMDGKGESRVHYSAQADSELKMDDETAVVGMFTNLIWDASLEVENCPFNDVLDWVAETIDLISDLDNTKLIIKTHPAEEIRGTNESVMEWIHDRFSTLPDSVSVLPPDTDVNTYELIRDLDSAIVYNSTVGLEASYLGTPVVTAGETHYRNLGITHDPQTECEYVDLIEDISKLKITTKMHSRAVRYLYYLFYQKHLTFPFISYDDGSPELKPVTGQNINKTKDILDTIVENCTNGNPVLSPRVQY